jgi:hypothetical protein
MQAAVLYFWGAIHEATSVVAICRVPDIDRM